MMKKTGTIIFILSFPLFSSSQSIVDTNKIWDSLIFYYWPQHYGTEKIIFISDTILGGLHYKKVIRSLEEYPAYWSFYGFIREDSAKRVFYRISGNEQDKMIYSMNIELFDTVNVYSLINFENNLFYNMNYFIDSIDSIMIGNSYKKRYHMAIVEVPYGLTEWIDGIGGTSGMLHNWDGSVGGDNYLLLCYTENDTLKYMDPFFNSCYVATGLENKIDKNIDVNIFHDPVNDVSTIKIIGLENGNGVKIDLFNSIGKKIKTKTNITEIQISHNELPSGIYLYCIYRNSEKIGSGKFLIN